MDLNRRVTLTDGRTLAYAEFGTPGGAPVLYFHGSPSSRLEPLLVGDGEWARRGLRVIAPDRPGMGGSTFHPGRRLTDWPADVAALADALGLARFAVLGNSGGAPYVAACGALIPDRLTAAVVVSGGWRMDWPEARDHLPFVNRVALTLAGRCPPLSRLLLAMMGGVAGGDRDRELAQLKGRVPPADYAAFAAPGRVEAFGAVMRECLRPGARGAARDLALYMRDFGFRLADVRVPVALFHGEADTNAPLPLARRAAKELPGARFVTYPGEAHLSTFCRRIDAYAAALRRPAVS